MEKYILKLQDAIDVTHSLAALDQERNQVKDPLNAIVPPLRQNKDGKVLLFYVSPVQMSRIQLKQLETTFQELLYIKNARQQPLCPVRQTLFKELWDEIIRQVTIDCPERGLFLMRIRDQRIMTIAAHSVLLRSAVAFGKHQSHLTAHSLSSLQQSIHSLETQKLTLQQSLVKLNTKYALIRLKHAQRNSILKQKREQELKAFQEQKLHLIAFLQSYKAKKQQKQTNNAQTIYK